MIFRDENRHDSGSLARMYGDKLTVEARNQIELKTAKHAKRMK